MTEKKIVRLDIAFYVDSDDEARRKMDHIFDVVDDVMCEHGDDESIPCNMVACSGQIMTGEQYDEWFDRMYPENP